MMHTFASTSAFSPSGWILSWIGATLWIGGAILLASWAIRSLTLERLRAAGAWMLAIGAITIVIASAWGFTSSSDPMSAAMYGAPDTTFSQQGPGMPQSVRTNPSSKAASDQPDHLMGDGRMMDSRSMGNGISASPAAQ